MNKKSIFESYIKEIDVSRSKGHLKLEETIAISLKYVREELINTFGKRKKMVEFTLSPEFELIIPILLIDTAMGIYCSHNEMADVINSALIKFLEKWRIGNINAHLNT